MENIKKYKSRLIEKDIKKYLKIFGAINVVGPKWCGKSWTSKFLSKSEISFADYIDKGLLRIRINDNPSFVLDGEEPRLIDEWQDAPSIWDAIRRRVDNSTNYGKYILTGSSSTKVETSHSGIGRIAKIKMYPMSLYESGESNGLVSLSNLFNGKFNQCKSSLTLKDIIFMCCRGGWPELIDNNLSPEEQLIKVDNYYDEIYLSDMLKVDNIKRNSSLMKSILKSYARNISTLSKNKTIIDDAQTNVNTFNSYLNVLKDMYIVEELEPWNTNLRSSSIRNGTKREFVDPSIACAALSATPDKLYNDLNTFGFIFETLCIRDLRIYSSSLGGKLYYYSDKTGLECDCVLVLRDGRYALIEIKLADAERIQEGIDNMNKIEQLVIKYNESIDLSKDTNRIKEKLPLPSFKMVITNDPISVNKENNVYIVSIGCLKD